MQLKKIIPCIDFKDGRVVKGTNFVGLRDAGDPVELAVLYCAAGADELTFLDISATVENRSTVLGTIGRIAEAISGSGVPFAVGGGVRCSDDIGRILDAGADKVGINSAAVRDKNLIALGAEKYGSARIVSAIDVKLIGNSWKVIIDGGRTDSGLDAIEWAAEVERLGAGEILLTSMNADGTKNGYDIEITRIIAETVKIPVTASGGAGKREDFLEIFEKTGVAAALAATLFHFREVEIPDLKRYLRDAGVNVRI